MKKISFRFLILFFIFLHSNLNAVLWIERNAQEYFGEIEPVASEFPGYDPFFACMGDINADGLADLVWMSKDDPFAELPNSTYDTPFTFARSRVGFSINRGAFENPEFLKSHNVWGMLWGFEGEKVAEVTVPCIVNWDNDGFGDIISTSRDERLHPPVWYRQNNPSNDIFDFEPIIGKCHRYFEFIDDYLWENITQLFVPSFPGSPWCGGTGDNLYEDWVGGVDTNPSATVADVNGDGFLDIITGRQVDPRENVLYDCGDNPDRPGGPSPAEAFGKIFFWINPGTTQNSWILEIPNIPQIDRKTTSGVDYDAEAWYDEQQGTVFPMPYTVRQRANPAIGDVDNDGKLEMIIGTVYGDMICYKMGNNYLDWNEVTETYLPRSEVPVAYDRSGDIPVGMNTRPSLFDIDYDGDLDLLVWDTMGNFEGYVGRYCLHLYENQTSKVAYKINVICEQGSIQSVFPGGTATFKWRVTNTGQHFLHVKARLVAYHRDNHPFDYPDPTLGALYKEEGTIPPGYSQMRQLSYTFPAENETPMQGYGDQRFYFELTEVHDIQTQKLIGKARAIAIVNVQSPNP